MSSIHRVLFFTSIIIIFVMGLVMIFNTTSAEVLDYSLDKSTHLSLLKQFFYAFGGIALAYGAWRAGYKQILAWTPGLLLFFTFLLVLTLIPGIGREVNGSRRWLGLAGFSFQPSEFVKYLAPAYFACKILEFHGSQITYRRFLQLVGIVWVPMLLIMVEPNNGTAGVIGVALIVVCVMTKVPFKFWAWPLIALMIVGGVFAYNMPYVTGRIKVYLNPELDLKGRGHQPYQAKIAAGSGSLLGRGPGNSLQKLSYLPEAQNDYIAAIFAEEFGFAGMLSLIILYMVIGYCGFLAVYSCCDLKGFYLGTIVIYLICFQAFMNLGVVSGLLPSTGLNLPLFSQGGTSLMANIMGLGILFSIACPKQEQGVALK